MGKGKCVQCGEYRCNPGYDVCWPCVHPDSERLPELDQPPLGEKAAYWKKYEKTLVQMAYDMNKALKQVDSPQRVAIPTDADSGWLIKERQEQYLNSRLNPQERIACG